MGACALRRWEAGGGRPEQSEGPTIYDLGDRDPIGRESRFLALLGTVLSLAMFDRLKMKKSAVADFFVRGGWWPPEL